MGRTRLLWQLYPSYLLVTIFSLIAVTWYASRSVRQSYLSERESDLKARATLVTSHLDLPLSPSMYDSVDQLCKSLGLASDTRITIVLADGVIVGDTSEDPHNMENHSDRPEFRGALSNGSGSSIRFSTTLGTNMMYVALPVVENGRSVAVVRTAIPVSSIDDALGQIYSKIAIGGLIIALLAAVLGLIISRRITRPLESLRRAAQRFEKGELSHTADVSGSEEIAALADAMNAMASNLDERIRTMERQKHQEAAVLRSMVESVLAIDVEERIIRVNRAASALLDIDSSRAVGRTLQETVRNPELIALVRETMQSPDPVEGDITLHSPEERFLQVHGSVLADTNGKKMGALLVLNDITQLRRLERVRQEFVANVSHELKTPITAIAGFVETLRSGALDDRADAERFLGIIARHARRLDAIIEDLLALSRLERDKEVLAFTITPLREVVESAVEICTSEVTARHGTVVVHDPDNVAVTVNAPLIEQAVVNLIDNAIKYSDKDAPVRVELEATRTGCTIRVIDKGCGISKEHFPRIFERFYRTDQARSRARGGTGLGLAIVKHVAIAHGGSVAVESTLGQGSVFSLFLPTEPVPGERGAVRAHDDR